MCGSRIIPLDGISECFGTWSGMCTSSKDHPPLEELLQAVSAGWLHLLVICWSFDTFDVFIAGRAAFTVLFCWVFEIYTHGPFFSRKTVNLGQITVENLHNTWKFGWTIENIGKAKWSGTVSKFSPLWRSHWPSREDPETPPQPRHARRSKVLKLTCHGTNAIKKVRRNQVIGAVVWCYMGIRTCESKMPTSDGSANVSAHMHVVLWLR